MKKTLEQKTIFEIEDRISNIIWDVNNSKSQVYASTWAGKLHTLRCNTKLWKIEETKKPKQISDYPLLSMDEDRNRMNKDINRLFLGDDSGAIFSYDTETEKYGRVTYDKEYRPMTKLISVNGSPIIFTFSWDRTMQIWDVRLRKNVYTHVMKENIVAAEYMHPYIILVFGNNSISFINVETYVRGSPIKEKPIEHDGLIKSLAFDASHQYLALGDTQGKIKIMKMKRESSGSPSVKDTLSYQDFAVELEYGAHFSKVSHLDGNPKEQKIVFPVNAVSFNPKDNGLILSAGGDCSIYSLDTNIQNGKRMGQYFYQRKTFNFLRPFTHMKFNEEGTAILTAELDHNLIETLENPHCEYKATSTLRILKLTEDSEVE